MLKVGLVCGLFLAIGLAVWFTYFRHSPTSVEQPKADEERVLDRFVGRRNAGDPGALKLLGNDPHVPSEPISESDADRLNTDFFLRDDFRVEKVLRGEPDGKGGLKDTPGLFTLVTNGDVSAPTLRVRTNEGIDVLQRTMTNPDLVVEVRDGKIFGVRAGLAVWR